MADNFNILDISPLNVLLARQNVNVIVTGTLAETTVFSTIIKGGIMSPNAYIHFIMWLDMASVTIVRLKYAGNIIATFNPNKEDYIFGSIINRDDTQVQLTTAVDFNLVPQYFDGAEDTTLDQAFEITFQPNSIVGNQIFQFIELDIYS